MTSQRSSKPRLRAVDGDETVRRKVGVQHIPSAKIAETKFTRPCSSCCCLSHCEKNPHNDENDEELKFAELDVANKIEVDFRNMLDKSWMEAAEYEKDLLNSLPSVKDKFMSLLCSVNLDLRESELEDQAASADNIMV